MAPCTLMLVCAVFAAFTPFSRFGVDGFSPVSFLVMRPYLSLPFKSKQLMPCPASTFVRMQVVCYQREGDEEQEDPVLISAVSRFASILSTPIPGIPIRSLAVGYPLALITLGLATSWETGVLSTALFAVFSWLGRFLILDENDYDYEDDLVSPSGQIIDNDNEELDSPPSVLLLDFLCLTFAVLITTLLLPPTVAGPIDYGLLVGIPVALLALVQVVASLQGTADEKATPQDRLLRFWDRQFRRDSQSKRTRKTKKKKENDDE